MRESMFFRRLSQGQQYIARKIASFLFGNVGAYQGSESDALTDAASMVEELHLTQEEVDLREQNGDNHEQHTDI